MTANMPDRPRCTRPVVLCIPCAVTEVIDTAARTGAILEATDHGLVVHGPLPPASRGARREGRSRPLRRAPRRTARPRPALNPHDPRR